MVKIPGYKMQLQAGFRLIYQTVDSSESLMSQMSLASFFCPTEVFVDKYDDREEIKLLFSLRENDIVPPVLDISDPTVFFTFVRKYQGELRFTGMGCEIMHQSHLNDEAISFLMTNAAQLMQSAVSRLEEMKSFAAEVLSSAEPVLPLFPK